MVRLIKGFAGSGKTTKLIDDVYALIDTSAVNPYQVLVLTLTPVEKNELMNRNQKLPNSKHLNIWSLDELLRYILKKSPSDFENKVLSDSLATNIISTICKSEFIANSALNNLTKSNSFFRELYNLFGLFKNNEINVEILNQVIDVTEIADADKIRLRLISSVFEKYNQTLNKFNYLDYRDLVISAVKALEENKILLSTIKLKFDHIFIDGLEDITYLQFKLIKLISDSDNLYLYGDEYSRIQEFRGAWRDNLIVKSLKEQFEKVEVSELTSANRNSEIIERAIYLVKKYNSEEKVCEFKKSECINYVVFEDIQAEISTIAEEILEKVKSENYNFSDFAILIRDYEAKQKFIDLFKSYQIPINSELYNEDFQNFKLQLNRYLNICNVSERLGAEELSKKGFSAIKMKSKAEHEILHEELNLYIENLLSDILDDNYAKDKFVAIKEQYKKTSLIGVVYQNTNILKEEDKTTLISELEDLELIYKLYKDNNFVELILFAARKGKAIINNFEFNKILGRLLSKTKELSDLYSSVLKVKLEFNTVMELINQSFEEQSDIKNSVNLLTFFKSAGQEFKCVYIPCLTENNFPKKEKATYFISPDANEKVSQNLRAKNANFRNLIELDKDGIEEESRLFYLGMTRAEEKLLISTHKYEEKKQVQPSIFFQLLADADRLNYSEFESQQTESDAAFKIESTIEEKAEVSKVIADGDVLKLSASSISSFLSCPRAFYFKSLLNLKEEGTFAANYGTIVHSVMEVFNNKCLDKYNKETLLALANILFRSKFEPQKALDVGFKQQDIDLIIDANSLSLAEMQENFNNAIEDLESKMFFSTIPNNVKTEKSFKFQLEELPNVTFDGRIDAICGASDGYSVIDYKTGKNKDKELEYYVSENGVNFLTKGGKVPSNPQEYQNGYEYQIPLYYLACQNAEELAEFKDKVSVLGLKYIRPTSKDDGCKEDLIAADSIKEYQKKIIQNLKETVIDKILDKNSFEPKKNYIKCENCSFSFLCDEEGDNND